LSGVALIAGLYEAFGRGDVPAVLSSMDPEIRWHEAEGNPYMPSGEAWIGPDAILNNLFVKLGEEWDGFTVHPGTFHDAGDVVVVEARYTGTYNATGKPIDAQVCHVWTITEGKITKFQQYLDTAKMQDVTGQRTFS
jgi:ketosteroid isomerase-like protein